MAVTVLALSLLGFVAANEPDAAKAAGRPKSMAIATDWNGEELGLRALELMSGNTVSSVLSRAAAVTKVHHKMKVGVSAEVQDDDDDAALLPSSESELQLTAAISKQSQKVKKEATQLSILQGKINSTVLQQQYAAYKYEVATRVSKQVVAAYLEAEKYANNSQQALKDAQRKNLEMVLNLTKVAAVRKGIEMQLDMVSSTADNETSTLESANSTALESKREFIAADNESTQALGVLANRSGDLQEAMDLLNAFKFDETNGVPAQNE